VADDRRFLRSQDRILGGVCAGLAEGFHVDPLWVRILFVLLVFLQGVGVFLYVVLWLVLPERLEGGATRAGFDSMTVDLKRISGEMQRQFGTTTQGSTTSPTTAAAPDARPQPAWQRQPSIFGMILVVVGLVVLGTNIGVINWAVVWPAALITIGIVLLVRNMERRP
jgi:phage shock protein C